MPKDWKKFFPASPDVAVNKIPFFFPRPRPRDRPGLRPGDPRPLPRLLVNGLFMMMVFNWFVVVIVVE